MRKSYQFVAIVGGANLAPALIAGTTLSGGALIELGVSGGPVIVAPVIVTGEQGAIIGWGTGQAAAAVLQTQEVVATLTAEKVAEMAARGRVRRWVEQQLAKYMGAIAQGGARVQNNTQLLARRS